MSLNGRTLRRARLAFWLPVLLGIPAAAAAQTVLVEDGAFANWVTTALTADQVQGGQDRFDGAPAPSYRVEHVHTSASSGGFGVVSRSVYTGTTLDFSSFDGGDRLELRVDVCLIDPGTPPPFDLDLFLTPVLLQGETTFRTGRLVTQEPNGFFCSSGSRFRRHILEVPLGEFVSAGGGRLDLAAGAPRVQFGLVLQTIWPTVGTGRALLDNLRVRRIPAAGLPLSLELTDLDQAWDDLAGETIGYRVRVGNTGPPRTGLLVEMTVPGSTCFSAAGSTIGWECGQNMSRRCSVGDYGLCTYRLPPLGTGERSELSFTVLLGAAGVPREWEFFAEARLLSQGGEELATEEEVTLPANLGGPGCFCLFLPGLCEN